jgi:hypothetical protein
VKRRVLALAVLALVACTPVRHRAAPYRHDPTAAKLLEADAVRYCAREHGAAAVPPTAFTTDACTLWPDDGWAECCVAHDMAYWCGGTGAERRAADETLRACIARHERRLATLMLVGVRAGGAGWMPTPWRWGYGWRWPRWAAEPGGEPQPR